MAMDLVRIIQVFVVQFGLGLVMLIIGIRILQRDTKRINQLIATFYISEFVGTLFNVIYAPFEVNPLVYNLHILTVFFTYFGPVMLTLFTLVVYKSQKIITTPKQLLYMIGWIIYLIIGFLIPGGITINESSNWKPVWSATFSLYIIIGQCLYWTILLLYVAFKVNSLFEDPLLKSKWKFFLIGIIGELFVIYGVPLANWVNDPLFRTVNSLISLIGSLLGIFGIYKGIGQQVSKKK
ncbi:MAG: hypothetical protein ACTSRZ_00950 [Promethearchaeota archaeon]